MTTTATPTPTTKKLAFRLERGDVIRHGGRLYRVAGTTLAVRFPRGRHETSRPVYKVTLFPARKQGRSSVVVFEQTDLVSVVR